MRTIIAGGREVINQLLVDNAIVASGFQITEVVSGGAPGVDTLGEQWAANNTIPVKRFPAEWSLHGKAAGPIRNRQMAEYAEALVAVWDGLSRGTKNMIDTARMVGLKVFIFRYPE